MTNYLAEATVCKAVSEMLRNSLGLNYKSAALPTELIPAKMRRTLIHVAA